MLTTVAGQTGQGAVRLCRVLDAIINIRRPTFRLRRRSLDSHPVAFFFAQAPEYVNLFEIVVGHVHRRSRPAGTPTRQRGTKYTRRVIRAWPMVANA
jgi:hypothetical protein